ncbi:MAG: hypothetical protein ACRD3Q_04485 [Terriglobales bacterium]
MNLGQWSKSNLEYGRKVVASGLEGARSGREAFLNGKSFTPLLGDSLWHSWKPAVAGACLGLLGGYRTNGNRSANRALAYGFLGGAIGFTAAVAWENRRLAASVARQAHKEIDKVRDEHWLERHPIDYA